MIRPLNVCFIISPGLWPLVASSSSSSSISLGSAAVRGWRLQMAEHQQQKGWPPPLVAQRPDSGEPHRLHVWQLFSTKLARDEHITKLHAVNTIKRYLGHLLRPLQPKLISNGRFHHSFRKVRLLKNSSPGSYNWWEMIYYSSPEEASGQNENAEIWNTVKK